MGIRSVAKEPYAISKADTLRVPMVGRRSVEPHEAGSIPASEMGNAQNPNGNVPPRSQAGALPTGSVGLENGRRVVGEARSNAGGS